MLHLLNEREEYPNKEGANRLFVYGTLGTGQANHDLMEGMIRKKHAKLESTEAIARGCVVAKVGGLPMLYNLWDGPDHRHCAGACGEVYLISPEARTVLDAFEGHPHLYSRQAVVIRYKAGGRMRESMAGAYFGPTPAGPAGRGELPVGRALFVGRVEPGGPVRVESSWFDRNMGINKAAYYYDGRIHLRPANEENAERHQARGIRFRNPIVFPADPPVGDEPVMWEDEEVNVLDGDEANEFDMQEGDVDE